MRRVVRELAGGEAYQVCVVRGSSALSFNVCQALGEAYVMELYTHRPGDENECELIGGKCNMELFDVLRLSEHKRAVLSAGARFGSEQPEAVWQALELLFVARFGA